MKNKQSTGPLSAAKQYQNQIAEVVHATTLPPLERGELTLAISGLIDTALADSKRAATVTSLTTQGMADCMDMVHRELIEAGIIPKETAPMMITDAVLKHLSQRAEAPTSGGDLLCIDTPRFQELLLADEVASPDRDDGAHMRKKYDECRSALITHINDHIRAALVAAEAPHATIWKAEVERLRQRLEAARRGNAMLLDENDRLSDRAGEVSERQRAAALAGELPPLSPLPRPKSYNDDGYIVVNYTDEQVQEYARAYGQLCHTIAVSAAQALCTADETLRAFGRKVGYEIGSWVDATSDQPDVEAIVDQMLDAFAKETNLSGSAAATDTSRLDLIERIINDRGYFYLHSNRPRFELTGLHISKSLRKALDDMLGRMNEAKHVTPEVSSAANARDLIAKLEAMRDGGYTADWMHILATVSSHFGATTTAGAAENRK